MMFIHNGWLRQSISDENGLADIAYVSLGSVTVLVLGAIVYVCGMSAWDWYVCKPLIDDHKVLMSCRFDSLPIGQSIGLICGAYAAALTALAGYMAATRKPAQPKAPDPSPPAQVHLDATIPQGSATVRRPMGKQE